MKFKTLNTLVNFSKLHQSPSVGNFSGLKGGFLIKTENVTINALIDLYNITEKA
jgi:hypothetical protein